MHLLSLSLQKPGAISHAVYGNFSAPKAQEICVARGNAIELLAPDETGKVLSVCHTPVFCVVRSLTPFRLSGANRDYLVIGSDSGKISIVEFDAQLGDWKVIHCEVYGKTGCRRIVPGQYVAADPKGRALMVAGIEKQKFVYVMSRDAGNRLTISSPLEAHKAEVLLFSCIGLDVGFENPVFAMIELEYTEADADQSGTGAKLAEVDKKLTYYELDLGLNHVVRKWSEPIARTANILIAVPGGDDGPSGVIICGENWISYKNQGHVEIRAPLPRRFDLPSSRGLLITTGVVHKQKSGFFFLVQSEYGDLYKVTLQLAPDNPKAVANIVIVVFDTIQPANSFCITRVGLLYVASEFGNHSLYQFQGLGDDPDAVKAEAIFNDELGDDAESASKVAPLFKASEKLQNLLLIDDSASIAPVTDLLVENVTASNELDSTQMYTLCGSGIRSSLRLLKHGLPVSEMAVSELPGKPLGVWMVRERADDASDPTPAYDKYIVVGFSNSTIVLSVGDTVEEVHDSGLLGTTGTLQVALMADNSLIQVHFSGIRHIRGSADRADRRVNEWKTPGQRAIERAAINSRQAVISLARTVGEAVGEIIYFELNAAGQLTEAGSVTLGVPIVSMDMGLVTAGRARSNFLAVGCEDNTVQVLSLDPGDMLSQRALMSVSARPDSVCMAFLSRESGGSGAIAVAKSALQQAKDALIAAPLLYLHVGLATGVLVRVAVDLVSGSLSDSRQRFLGPKAVKLFRVMVREQPAVVALSSRPWLLYNYQGRHMQSPMSYMELEVASSFTSEPCPEGIIACAGNTLRIFTVDNVGSLFNQTTHRLRYTPRRLARIPGTALLVTIETDQHEYNEAEKAVLASSSSSGAKNEVKDKANDGGDMDEEREQEQEEEATILPVRGPVPPTIGKWASCIRVSDAANIANPKLILELSNNEAAFSMCVCKFAQHSDEQFIIVGIAKDLRQHPRSCSSAHIDVYRLLEDSLQLLHRTTVEEVPLCMCEFQGRLLVGCGTILRLYDLGKKTLLRKCENRSFPNLITRIQVHGDRVFAGDVIESVFFVKYQKADNALCIFADDDVPRYVNSLCVLDHDTICSSDKFGNIFVHRLPDSVDDSLSVSQSSARTLWDQDTRAKLSTLCHYYLGEMVTSMTRCALIPGAPEVLVASTITGGIYAFLPFSSKEDITFFTHLEMFMRQEHPSLCQRDHMAYRSYYQPVKHVVDGDLCERYGSLPLAKQGEFAHSVGRTPAEVFKKLEEIRHIL